MALLVQHIDKNSIAFLFLSCLPLDVIPQLSQFSSSLHLPLSFLAACSHSLCRVPRCVSLFIIISTCAVPYCWESKVIIIFLLSSPLFFPLFLSLWLPLIRYPSWTILLCCCEVDPTSGHPTLPHCAPLSSVGSSFCPLRSIVLATETCHCEKRQFLSSAIKWIFLGCFFRHSVCHCFCHGCYVSPLFSVPVMTSSCYLFSHNPFVPWNHRWNCASIWYNSISSSLVENIFTYILTSTKIYSIWHEYIHLLLQKMEIFHYIFEKTLLQMKKPGSWIIPSSHSLNTAFWYVALHSKVMLHCPLHFHFCMNKPPA